MGTAAAVSGRELGEPIAGLEKFIIFFFEFQRLKFELEIVAMACMAMQMCTLKRNGKDKKKRTKSASKMMR